MHIITGLLITKLLTGNFKEKGFKGFIGVIEIVHSISGRVRFFIPALKNEPEKCLQLKKQLEKASAFKMVSSNPVSGSLIIEFDPEKIDIQTITGAIIKVLGLEEAIESTPKSFMSKELKNIYSSLNTGVYEYSNGIMDLNSLLTTSFLTLGFYSFFRNRSVVPSGLSLFYWAILNMQRE